MRIITASPSHIPLIRNLAEKIWWATYPSILKEDQISFMLETLYNENAIKKAMETDQEFILLELDDYIGFASFGPIGRNSSTYKLHKLYVLPEYWGKGYGRIMIQEITHRLKALGLNHLILNVNRFNTAKIFYEKLGFQVIKEEDIPIGPYWMNDYVMRLEF